MSDDRRKALASVIIVLVIGLHAVPVVYPPGRGTLWPFMVYAMYKHSRPSGPVEVNQRYLVGVTASGTADSVTPERLGVSITVLDQRFHRPLMGGDTSVVPALFERLNRGRTDPYVEVRLLSQTYTLTESGLTRLDNPVRTFRLAGR